MKPDNNAVPLMPGLAIVIGLLFATFVVGSMAHDAGRWWWWVPPVAYVAVFALAVVWVVAALEADHDR